MKAIFTVLWLGVAVSAASAQETAQPSERRSFTGVRLGEGESITLDGRLDEAVWKLAQPASDFIQMDPDNGVPATERTEVRAVFDRNRLYLGVICFDSDPNGLMANTLQRDEPFAAGDKFQWTIDTFLDGRTGYFFEINPAGAMGDGLLGQSKQWDGIWNVRVHKSEIGWTAEIELPFKTFNFDPNGNAWGINFQRSIRRKEEESLWMGHLRNQGLRRMTNAGRLAGLSDLTQGIGLDIKPYLVGGTTSAPGRGDARTRANKDVGVDVFYNLTPGLKANLTVNTDFAQTEVDQRLINLTRFPLFFPEKRDFFLDGASFFDFAREPDNAVLPFFSRRIGLNSRNLPQTIDVGAKLTGQYGAQDIGFFQVRTGEEDDALGEDFTVLRLKRRMLRQSYVGTLYTRRNTRDANIDSRSTAGLDFLLGTSTFMGSQNLELSGFYLWTTNLLDTGRSAAYGARLEYPNDLWNAAMSFREIQENYAPAVGFVPRTGYRRYNPNVLFSPRPKNHSWIRRVSTGADADLQTDMHNRSLTRILTLTPLELELNSTDSVEFKIIPTYERLEQDFRIIEGVVLPRGAEYDFTRYRIEFETATRRKVQLGLTSETGGFYSGDRRELGASVSLRPRLGVHLTLDGTWNKVDLPEGRFTTRVYRFIGRTQFSPWASLVNTVQYDSVSKAVGWQSRLRWMWRPGNDFYFVYTHNWQDQFSGFTTLDRQLATKVTYTHRF